MATTHGEDPTAVGGSGSIDADATTQADEEWPVAREYRVEPYDGKEALPDRSNGAGAMVVAAPPRSRRLSLYIGAGLLGALLAALLVSGAAIWLASRGDDNRQSGRASAAPASRPAATSPKKALSAPVTVPDVARLEFTQARSALEDAGLRVRSRSVPSDTAAAGDILRQSPAAGSDVAPQSVVTLTVSAGKLRIQVPAVTGLMASSATSALEDAGLRAEIRLVRSVKKAGTVLDQAPSPGAEVSSESVVRLEVAKASPTIAMPRLLGSTAAQARLRLRSLGLRSILSRVDSAEPSGTVVGQSPRAGSRLRKGQTVTLEISTGPAEVTVPDVVGLDEQTARQQLEAAGFHVQVIHQATTDPNQDGMVIEQAPVGGSKSEETGPVTLTVARLG